MLKTDKVIYRAESKTVDSLPKPFDVEEISAVYEHNGVHVSVTTSTFDPDMDCEFTRTSVHLMGGPKMGCDRFSDFVVVEIGPVKLFLDAGDERRLAAVLMEES